MTLFIRNFTLVIFLAVSSYFNVSVAQSAQDEAAEHETNGEEEHEEGVVELTPEQQSAAGIEASELAYQSLAEEIQAPGEVIINTYQSSQVTPRINAQITARLTRLGDRVEQNQPLVRLSSVEMAEAQGDLLVSSQEWERIRQLGKEILSEARYIEAEVGFQKAQAKVLAFGMTTDQVQTLMKQNDVTKATGEFELLAPQDGTIFFDDFVVGEVIEEGRVLFKITDESIIWVETSLPPTQSLSIERGTIAHVQVNEEWLPGRVIQSHHTLNETTRTLAVRIEVPNPDEKLHPGLFVNTRIQGNTIAEVLAVPEDAVLRGADGDSVVFIEEEPGHFKSVEVEVIRSYNGLAVIEGIEPGTRVVVKGAFFVQSELAKSGFEVHNH